MVNAILAKFGAWVAVGIALLIYPTVLLAATLWTVYRFICGQPACKKIAGDIAVVTGAGRGLGKCIAEQLAQNGCHVAIVDVNYAEAETTARSIAAIYNVKAKAYKVDVTNYEEVVKLNESISKDIGEATILVNNAGLLLHKNPMKPDWREVQSMINVNLTAHFWTNSVFLPNMKKQKRGHIVAICSVAGLFPLMYSSTYTATKYAVRALMNTLRLELKSRPQNNIYATTVFPSFLQTNKQVVDIAQQVGLDSIYPLISGEEVAERVVYAIQRNEEEITVPVFFAILFRLYESLPAAWRDWIFVKPSQIFEKAAVILGNIRD